MGGIDFLQYNHKARKVKLNNDIVMKKELLVTGLSLGIPLLSWGCDTPTNNGETTDTNTDTGSGTINLVANGEAFARQEFVTKDDWTINFDHVYVTLDQVTAYQSDPAFNPDKNEEISAEQEVTLLSEAKTVDLAKGDGPLTVTKKQAPVGEYNAIAWQVVSPEQEKKADSAIVLDGTAEKDGKTIDFVLNLDQPLSYQCGEYVGEVRKGILEADGETELETTFHFDHIFGDGEAAEDAEINTNAVGFAPMADLANENRLETDLDALEQQLSSQDYDQLMESMKGLGHVGEGHCQETLM